MCASHEITDTVLKVSCRSRAQRVAFLVDPAATTAEQLDRTFAWAMRHWGGRYHAFFPVVSGDIPKAWWKALALLDPDAVVTFGSLIDACVDRIERTILPARILGLRDDERKRYVEGDHLSIYGLDPIGINAVPRHIWANRGPLEDPVFVLFKRRYPIERNNQVILRNFGVLSDDVGTQAAFRDLPTQAIDDSSTALSDVLVQLAKIGSKAVLPLDLCAYGAAVPTVLQYEHRTRGFHLTIGDSAYDAIYHWNRAMVAEQGSGRTSFWLPASALADESLIEAAREWIDRFYWESGGVRSGAIVSYSLKAKELSDVAKRLPTGANLFLEPRVLSPNDFPFPDGYPASFPDSKPAFELPGRASLNAHTATQQVPFPHGQALVAPIVPPFLDRFGPGRGWMVDVQLQFHPDRYWYTNVRPDWTLPKRRGLTELFVRQDGARVVGGGLPAVEVQGAEPEIAIRVPQDRDVFWTLIFGNPYAPRWAGMPTKTTRFREMWTSDEGALLRGMLRLFGTLYHCGHTLGDPFWGPILTLLAQGKPSRRRACTRTWLRQQFGRMRGEARNAARDAHYWESATSFDDCAGRDFEWLVRIGILKQGTEIRCTNCGSTFWYGVDQFRPGTPCVGCGEIVELPIEAVWFYRLNDMVANAIENSGTCAVVQALYMLEREARGMFLALPCQNLADAEDGPAVTDVDILAIVGTRFVIGEVKSSPTGFQRSEVDQTIELAKKLRPDEVVFAAPGRDWPADVEASVSAATETLAPLGIKARAIKMYWW